MTSGAAANAVPVAEFTVAAILFANKDVFGARERARPAGDDHPWPKRHRPVGNLGQAASGSSAPATSAGA